MSSDTCIGMASRNSLSTIGERAHWADKEWLKVFTKAFCFYMGTVQWSHANQVTVHYRLQEKAKEKCMWMDAEIHRSNQTKVWPQLELYPCTVCYVKLGAKLRHAGMEPKNLILISLKIQESSRCIPIFWRWSIITRSCNHILNSTITSADTRRAEEIYLKDIATLRGKSTQSIGKHKGDVKVLHCPIVSLNTTVMQYWYRAKEEFLILGSDTLSMIGCWIDAVYALYTDMKCHMGGFLSLEIGGVMSGSNKQNAELYKFNREQINCL